MNVIDESYGSLLNLGKFFKKWIILGFENRLSTKNSPIDLKFYHIANFDIGFQKNNIRSRNSKIDYFNPTILKRTRT